jgi:hypothetical protein
MSLEDRRSTKRYPIQLPVLFEHERGETRDISTSGAYILADQYYPPESEIAFTLRFDLTDQTREKPLFLACLGRVLRSEPQFDRHGMAVRFLDSSLHQPFSALSSQEGDIDNINDLIGSMSSLHHMGV